MPHGKRFSAALAVMLALAGSGAAAQSVAGRVVDDATGDPIGGARLVLLDTAGTTHGQAFSDEDGRFRIAVPEAGAWVVGVEFIGHTAVRSEALAITPDDEVVLEVRMGIEPVAVGSIVVRSRMASVNPQIRAFYDRVERGRTSGLGRFVTREEIEEQHPIHPSDLLRTMAGIRVVHQARGGVSGVSSIRMSRGCAPAIYVDGTQINRMPGMGDNLDQMVAVSSIEGIEVYRGAGVQVGRFRDARGCGLILVWTRRGTDEGESFSPIRLLAGIGILIGLLLIR